MPAQGLCLSFPWSEVPGEPVQQCWRWLQLQGNAVTHHSSFHFVQTPGSGLSAGTSQPSWGGRDGWRSRRCGKIIKLGWHLRSLTCVRVLPSPADHIMSKWQFCYVVRHSPVSCLQGQLRTSCLPTPLLHVLILPLGTWSLSDLLARAGTPNRAQLWYGFHLGTEPKKASRLVTSPNWLSL